jgi:hypothetical protein
MKNVDKLLGESRKPVRQTRLPVAIVAGAIGRRGETMLNTALARGGYGEVIAIAEHPVSVGMTGLSVRSIEDLPQARDLFIVMADAGDGLDRSFHGRDAAFVEVNEANINAIVTQAMKAGVERVLVIEPTPVWMQFGGLQRTVMAGMETDLAQLNLTRLAILRPLRDPQSSEQGIVQQILRIYLSLQMVMMRSIEPVTSEQLARAALNALNSQADGVSVIPAADLAEWAKKKPAEPTSASAA